MQLTQPLRRNQLLYADRAATWCAGREKTWSELCVRTARLAAGLRARGARPGDRIGILSANSDYFVEAFYAIAWAGCVAVPFNTRWAPTEIEHALNECRPRLMLLGAGHLRYRELIAFAGIPVIGMDAVVDESSVDILVEGSHSMADESGSGHDLAAIFYTGGTTGRSKGVMVSHDNLVTNFFLLQAVQPYDSDTIFLHTPPLFHMAAASCLFGLTTLATTHVILPGFDALAAIQAIERHRITALLLVPTMIGMLCETLESRGGDLSSVRRLTYGASPISAAILKRAMKLMPNARFCQGYGQTEVSCFLCVLDHKDHLAGRLHSAGRPLPSVDVRVVDAQFCDVPTGEVGEIVTRGPCVMLGYWQQPETTAQTIVNGWLRTGDAGRFDAEGYIYLVDRVKDMIISGGENVFSAEVEVALMSHPDVLQCAVIGVPDERWGERVHAVIYLRDKATVTAIDLLAHCAPLIAKYKQPKSFDLRCEPLPLSAVGKIAKTELRKAHWSGQSRNIG